MGRPLRTVLVLAIAMVAVVPALAEGQSRMPTVRAARGAFLEAVDALGQLADIEPVPGDPDHELRAWDRRWRSKMERWDRLRGPVPFGGGDCRMIELRQLLFATEEVETARQLFWVEGGRSFVESAAATMARARLVADEAARRTRADLLCEELEYAIDMILDGVPGLADLGYSPSLQVSLHVARRGHTDEESPPPPAATAPASPRDDREVDMVSPRHDDGHPPADEPDAPAYQPWAPESRAVNPAWNAERCLAPPGSLDGLDTPAERVELARLGARPCFRECALRYRPRYAREGAVSVRVAVGNHGRVDSVLVIGDDFEHRDLAACVADLYRRLNFGRGAAFHGTSRHPWRFTGPEARSGRR